MNGVPRQSSTSVCPPFHHQLNLGTLCGSACIVRAAEGELAAVSQPLVMQLDPAGVRERRDGESIVNKPRHAKYMEHHHGTRKSVEEKSI